MDAPNQIEAQCTAEREALVREILVRMADRWTLLVIDALDGEEALRFSRLREQVDGISQRRLTKTLRQLERDGLVTRQVSPVVTPRVDYRLTALGMSLAQALCGIWMWAGEHFDQVDGARRNFDSRNAGPPR